MIIVQNPNSQRRIRNMTQNELGRSSSMKQILQGSPQQKSNDYVDSLERFKRDFASIDKQQRQRRYSRKSQNDQLRRKLQIQRQDNIKKIQQENFNKYKKGLRHSADMHEFGIKKTAHTASIPVNPISLQYQPNLKGLKQKQIDEANKVNQLVRAHHLQTCSTSGYNLINGSTNTIINKMIPQNSEISFQEKLYKFYHQFQAVPPK